MGTALIQRGSNSGAKAKLFTSPLIGVIARAICFEPEMPMGFVLE